MACAANLAAPGAAAQPASSYRGRTVQEVIDELRAHGAPIIYSTNLLSADLRVLDAPTTTEPLALAREILAPHGLTIDARDGLWLVVRDPNAPAQRTSRVTVAVVDAGGTPLADSTVWLDSIDGERRIAVEGKAQFDAVPAGRHVFRAQAPGYARGQAVLEVRAGASQTVTVALLEAVEPPALDELLVTASRYDVANQVPPSGAFFTREEIENLSDLGDDPLRVTHRLPGIAAGDWSARSYVRGGDRNEMAIFFDGMELIEPFHFRDYQGLFSTIDPRVVSGMQIYSGGFPVAYGGALSGLSIIDARMPTEPLQHEIGLSFLLTSLLSSGTFADGRAEWVASARRGNIDRWLKDERGEPSYRDLYVHVAGTVGKHRLAFNALNYDDDILLIPEDDPADLESSVSESDATQLWLRIDSDWTDDLSGTTVVSSTQFSNERTGLVSNQGQIAGAATDHRRLEGIGLRQDWQLDLTDRQLLTWGFEIRELDAEYDYASRVDVLDSLAALNPGTGTSQAAYRLRPGGHSRSVYFSDRIRFTDRLVADLGVRWDKQTYLPPDADEQISGRSSLLYQLAPATDLRLSYGRFFQAEGLIELQVEDGVVDFSPAQDASHAIVSVEHRFASDVMLRGEVFEKITRSPRPRYENLFDPFVVLPELRPGRVRIAPERGESQGVEILAIGQEPLSWWAAYTWSEANDIIDGRPVPRSWDQRHSLSGGVTWNMRQWTMSASATYHTGWPTTDLSLETVELPNGSAATVLALGERNAQSFAPFSRVDFATSRVVSAGHGTVKFFVEVTNLLDRANPCCVEFEVVSTPGGAPALKRSEDYWLPATLNAGVLWEF
jgi:hypothetical protein